MIIRDQIIRTLERTGDLPTLPEVALSVSRLTQDPNVSASGIASVLQHDPAFTARVLKVANSAAFGSLSRITAVRQAIARLGMRTIHQICMSISVIRLFEDKGRIDYPQFWKHSLSVALAAQHIAKHTQLAPSQSDSLFTAGILHDIGIILLDQYATEAYTPVRKTAPLMEQSLATAEQTLLGIHHAEVGALLLQRWKLPPSIIQAVLHHHHPCNALPEYERLAQLVHLANFACVNQGIHNGVGQWNEGFSDSAWFDIGLCVDDIPALISEVEVELKKSEVMVAVARD